jgi:nucleotide-binding universal stress UspA family protein
MTERTHHGRILVGVDPSPHAARAADWAAALAVDLGARLTVAHALDLPDATQRPPDATTYSENRHRAGERLLAVVAERITKRYPDLTVGTGLSELDPARALAGYALEADLMVTGTRGLGGFTGMLLGSVSNKLAAHAPCPLVVVGADQPTEAWSDVVLGVEQDEDAAPIEFAFDHAARLGLALRAVRVFEPVIGYGGYYGPVRPTIEQDLENLIKPMRARYPDVPVTVEASQGLPVPALAEAARGARLLVVGSHRRRGPFSFGPGHIVHGLLAHSETPVAVVPIP